MFSDRPGTPGAQRADAAHDEVDLDAGLRRLVERGDRLRFEQRVHLGDDRRLLAGRGRLRLRRGSRRRHCGCSVNGDCHRWVSVRALPSPVSCLKTSSTSAVISSLAGQQAEVGVQARGARMVVAGAEVDVAAQAAFLAPDDHQRLGVRLVADDAVDHVRADFLELARPADVGFLVEARHQLEHDRDFLAVLRGADQRLHQDRVGAGAVDRHLDADDLRVGCRLVEQVDDRLERLVRVVQQDVAAADASKRCCCPWRKPSAVPGT